MITLITQRFYFPDYDYNSTEYTEFLFGAIGDNIRAETTFEVHWETENVIMTFLASDDSIERNDGGSNSFLSDGFKKGDLITVSGTVSNNGSYTISSISDDGTIIFVTGALVNETSVRCSIFGDTPVTAIDFYPNICENEKALFFDLTDRETVPRYFATGISTPLGTVNMTAGTNSKGWITGDDGITNGATIDGISFTNHRQRFLIKHKFLLTPIFLVNQLKNIQDGLPPVSDYRERKCMKYVWQVDAKYTNYDPNIPQTAQFTSIKGNTGWFNEFINGNPTHYRVESIRITDQATGNQLDVLDYGKIMDVEVIISTSFRFDGFEIERAVINVLYLPSSEGEYINTFTDYKKNFILERAVTEFSFGGPVQGENTGDYHFIKNASTDFEPPLMGVQQAIKVSFTIDYSPFLINVFDNKDPKNYLIFIATETRYNSNTPLTSDRTALIVQTAEMVRDEDDASLFTIIDEVQFFEYPACAGAGFSTYSGFTRDTVLIKTQFYLKQNAFARDLTLKIQAQNSAGEIVVLESFPFNLSAFPLNCDGIQEISVLQQNNFKLENTNCRTVIEFERMPTLDMPGLSAYQINYPFKLRWEEWRSVFPANKCFPTPTQNWLVYENQPDWDIKFLIEANVESAGHITNFKHYSDITIKDPCNNTISVEIQTFDHTGVVDFDDLITENENTRICVTFKGDFTDYSASDLYAIIYLDAYGIGGINYIYQISNQEDNDDESPLQGIVADTYQLTLTKVDNTTVTACAMSMFEFLPTDTRQFILSARIGLVTAGGSSSGGCLNEILFFDFDCGELTIVDVIDANTIMVDGLIQTDERRNVVIKDMILELVVTSEPGTHWKILNNGRMGNDFILSGTVSTNTTDPPLHPYTNAIIDELIQGDVTGTINVNSGNSASEVNGIGTMQIGCTFFVS